MTLSTQLNHIWIFRWLCSVALILLLWLSWWHIRLKASRLWSVRLVSIRYWREIFHKRSMQEPDHVEVKCSLLWVLELFLLLDSLLSSSDLEEWGCWEYSSSGKVTVMWQVVIFLRNVVSLRAALRYLIRCGAAYWLAHQLQRSLSIINIHVSYCSPRAFS